MDLSLKGVSVELRDKLDIDLRDKLYQPVKDPQQRIQLKGHLKLTHI